ncbi:hypothetical protein N7462_008860 [Penicillium macrosclerotiorum]|uniref:uncharacterized protein n=1 Tax=Penicillium macrosclerotiorum TaxID=303699 RepID=UPI0025498D6B|nr:uncharacterized protein N7462_008860 [Penicillium macrosclerotiorum]KAJ5675963.1 hypothetical protein N7462_008860 [Penicillium macrosclerotiorum]
MDDNANYQSPPPRKRRRPALSCEQCRRRKVRCDREMPCGPCTKALDSLSCSYVHEGKAALDSRLEVSRISEEHSSSRSGIYEATARTGESSNELRFAQLESSIRALHDRVSKLENPDQSNNVSEDALPDNVNSGLSRSLGDLENRIAELEQRRVASPLGRSDQPRTTIPPLAPRLTRSGERMKLFGTTHWARAFKQFRLLRQVRGTASFTDSSKNEISRVLGEIIGLRRIIKGRQAPPLADPAPGLLNDLPKRELCDELVQHYLRTLGLIYRIMHFPSFYQEYERFWEQPRSASTAFVMKLLLILAIGSIFHDEPGPSSHPHVPVRRWIYAVQWWLTGPFAKELGSLESLQVHCLLLLCRQAHAIDKETNWMAAGTLLRQAVHQGLHRDPRHFPTVSPFDAEMRRRIWATVLEINVQFSIDAAMPPFLTPEDYDTRPPANLEDNDFQPNTSDMPPSQPKDLYTTSSLQTLLLQSLPTRLRIARVINECTNEQSYEAALKLGSELSALCQEVNVRFHNFMPQTDENAFKPTQFHLRLVESILRRFLLNLYRPFAIQATHDPRFYLSRKLSLDSALIMASFADGVDPSLEADLGPYQDYKRLSFSGAGVFKGPLSLDVIMVISLELVTQIEEEAAIQPPGSDSLPRGVLGQIAEAARAPLVNSLERIQASTYEGLVAGIPSVKRYGLLAGILAQVRSLPRGEEVQYSNIRKALLDSMRTCQTLLQKHVSNGSWMSAEGMPLTPAVAASGFTPESGIGSSLDSEYIIPNLGFEGWDFWDFPSSITGEEFETSPLAQVIFK